jgi:hypothetical protein
MHILVYVQHDATLHGSFYLEIALYVLGGTTTHQLVWVCCAHLNQFQLFHDSGR